MEFFSLSVLPILEVAVTERMLSMNWLFDTIVAPAVGSLVSLVGATVLPILVVKWVRYLNRRWKLDIDAREQAKLEMLAADVVHKTECLITGPNKGKEKITAAIADLLAQTAAAGIDIGEDVARAKLEKLLHYEGLKGEPAAVGRAE